MITDHQPTRRDDDDYIRAYARDRGFGHLPIVYVPLQEIDPKAPNMAIVHFGRDGAPVERVVMHAMAHMTANAK